MADESISVVIPHYNTLQEVNICLACIRYYSHEPVEIVVVDNGSRKEVLEAIELPSGSRLLTRQQNVLNQEPHKAALDLGIEHSNGELIVCMHSDAFVIHAGWLSYLKLSLADRFLVAGPPTHKLTPPTFIQRLNSLFKRQRIPTMIRPLFAVYRREVFAQHRFAEFADVGDLSMSFLQSGQAKVIPAEEAIKYVFHMGGTTRLANLNHRAKAKRRKARQFARFLRSPEYLAVRDSAGAPRLP